MVVVLFEGYQWTNAAAVPAQRSHSGKNQPPNPKHCSHYWNGLPNVHIQCNRHESLVRRPCGSCAKAGDGQNVVKKKLSSGGKAKSRGNDTSDVVNECSQINASHKHAAAKEQIRNWTVNSTQHLGEKADKRVRKCQTASNKQWKNCKTVSDHKLGDLQPHIDSGDRSLEGKCGKQTTKKSCKQAKKMKRNSTATESQQSEDLPGSTALQDIDESLAGENKETAKTAKTVDRQLTENPRKKENRVRFRDICLICKSAFSSRSLLSNHLVSVHSDDDKSLWPYPCRFCEERLLTFAQLRRHEREIHPEGYRAHCCQTCGKGFANEHWLRWHQIYVHNPSEKRFICDVCGKQYSHASKMEAHRRRHKNDRPHACPFCEKRFHMSCHLDVHVLQHLGVQPHACLICRRTFHQKSHLRLHVQHHHPNVPPQKPTDHTGNSDTSSADVDSDAVGKMHGSDTVKYHCSQCDVWFGDCTELKRHQTVAHPVKALTQFACTVCSHRFPSYADLNRHRKECSHGAEMVYVCDVCEDRFPTAFRLRVHRLRHLGERPFVCRRCGRRFRSQLRINSHVLRHADVLKYQCPKCSSVYYSSHLLGVHMLRHVVSDPFELTNHRDRLRARYVLSKFAAPSSDEPAPACICKECGCQFRSVQTLRVHVRSKHLLVQFSCAECGKHYSSSCNLRRHQLIHSGTRKYCCDVCGRQFTQSNTLKDHERIHSGARPFVCAVCGRDYTQSSNLRNHMQTHMH